MKMKWGAGFKEIQENKLESYIVINLELIRFL